jgi:urea transport system ATP-binding protein
VLFFVAAGPWPWSSATGALIEAIAQRCTLVVVEHDMEFLRRFARRVTVMHGGRVLSEGSVDHIRADPKVQEVYLGRSRDRRGHHPADDAARVEAGA